MAQTINEKIAFIVEAFGDCLDYLHLEGLVPPFFFTVLTANDQSCIGHVKGAWENLYVEIAAVDIAPPYQEEDWQMPLHLVFIDAKEQKAGIIIAEHTVTYIPCTSPTRADTTH